MKSFLVFCFHKWYCPSLRDASHAWPLPHHPPPPNESVAKSCPLCCLTSHICFSAVLPLVQGTIFPLSLLPLPLLSRVCNSSFLSHPLHMLVPLQSLCHPATRKKYCSYILNILTLCLKPPSTSVIKTEVLLWFTHCVGLPLRASPSFYLLSASAFSPHGNLTSTALQEASLTTPVPHPKFSCLPVCGFSIGFFSFVGHLGMWSNFSYVWVWTLGLDCKPHESRDHNFLLTLVT